MKSNKSESRQTITKIIPQTIDPYQLSMELTDLIQYFKDLQEKHKDEGTLSLDFDEEWFEIIARRLETDEEMEKRINKEKKIKEKSRLSKRKRDEQKNKQR